MPERPIDVLRRELLAVLNRAEQATAWEHRARAAEAALRELRRDGLDAALVDDMAAVLRMLRGRLVESSEDHPELDATRIDELLRRYDVAAPRRDRHR
jgi:hypothetical protein